MAFFAIFLTSFLMPRELTGLGVVRTLVRIVIPFRCRELAWQRCSASWSHGRDSSRAHFDANARGPNHAGWNLDLDHSVPGSVGGYDGGRGHLLGPDFVVTVVTQRGLVRGLMGGAIKAKGSVWPCKRGINDRPDLSSSDSPNGGRHRTDLDARRERRSSRSRAACIEVEARRRSAIARSEGHGIRRRYAEIANPRLHHRERGHRNALCAFRLIEVGAGLPTMLGGSIDVSRFCRLERLAASACARVGPGPRKSAYRDFRYFAPPALYDLNDLNEDGVEDYLDVQGAFTTAKIVSISCHPRLQRIGAGLGFSLSRADLPEFDPTARTSARAESFPPTNRHWKPGFRAQERWRHGPNRRLSVRRADAQQRLAYERARSFRRILAGESCRDARSVVVDPNLSRRRTFMRRFGPHGVEGSRNCVRALSRSLRASTKLNAFDLMRRSIFS